MATIVLIADQVVPRNAADIYESFGRGGSWLFNASCDAVRVGEPVSVSLPLDGADTVDILGKLTRCIPDRLLEISHELPWRGKLSIRLKAEAASTRLRVVAELGDDGIDWILRRRGWPAIAKADTGTHRIGLLLSKSGPGAACFLATENVAELAIEELNASGGLHGRPIELLVADDATDPSRAAAEAENLVRSGCQVILGGVISSSFLAAAHRVAATGIPLIQMFMNEGGDGPANVLRWGERPIDQIRRACGSVMAHAGRSWFFVGNNYSWTWGAHEAGARAIVESGGICLGSRRVPLGSSDFGPVLDAITASGADCVLSSLVGSDEIAFEQQASAAGLRDRVQTLSLVFDEALRERIGVHASRDLWGAAGYYEELDTPGNHDLRRRYRDRFGPLAVPLSTLSEPVYSALLLYAEAARHSPRDDVDEVVRQLHSVSALSPSGPVRAGGPHYLHQQIHLARSGADGLNLVAY